MVARNQTSPETLLIDAREAARLLSVSESSLVRLNRSGSLTVVQIGWALRHDPADWRVQLETRMLRREK